MFSCGQRSEEDHVPGIGGRDVCTGDEIRDTRLLEAEGKLRAKNYFVSIGKRSSRLFSSQSMLTV